MTSNNFAEGRFDKQDFLYIPEVDEYCSPAGRRATHRFRTLEHGLNLHKYWSSACPRCPIKSRRSLGSGKCSGSRQHNTHFSQHQGLSPVLRRLRRPEQTHMRSLRTNAALTGPCSSPTPVSSVALIKLRLFTQLRPDGDDEVRLNLTCRIMTESDRPIAAGHD